MKKLLLTPAACLLSIFLWTNSFGQISFSLDKAYDFIENRFGLDRTSLGELRITDQYVSAHNNASHIYLTQVYDDHEIQGTNIGILVTPDGQYRAIGHQLKDIRTLSFETGGNILSPTAAIQAAASSLGIQTRAATHLNRTMPRDMMVYDKVDISHQDIPVTLIYAPVAPNSYQLVYSMMIDSRGDGLMYQSYINASTGKVLANDVLTVSCQFGDGYMHRDEDCDHTAHTMTTMSPPAAPPVKMGGSYRALVPNAESPSHGNFDLLIGIEDPTASPFGWHDDNGVEGAEYTYTRGNNVHAFLDRNWDYSSDRNVDGGADLIFDFPFDDALNPSGNQDAATTNLFVRSNFMHDFTFHYGFNEQNGNYQAINYTGAGLGADYVNAHAQFGDDNITQCGIETNNNVECINNADFGPTVDGFNGRMRMFVWNQNNSNKLLDIIEPIDLAGKIITGTAEFGQDVSDQPVTGEVVIVDDGTPDASKGCNVLEGQDLTGKIAMIDRGLCDFSLKVFNAQEAGAIGAIICNFEDAILQMGSADQAANVVIPSVLISSIDCNRIRLVAGSGLVASLVAQQDGGAAFRDGSLDNGIIAHEYGHGVSNRLTGGPGTLCLGANFNGDGEESRGMGEGWSDFLSLVTSAQPGDFGAKRRGIGTYAIKESINGRGIRTFPYTTDMSVNSHTYDDIITESYPHGVGSVWCAMLWDLYWALSDEYGWDPDPMQGTGGNNMAIQLVMDGMILQPCQPSFVEARDAILMADSINNGAANSCLIWSVFARRGLGVNADAGSRHSRGDGKEDFDLPKSCLDDIRFSKTMTPEIVAGDNIEVSIKIVNYKDFALTNVVVEDPIPAGCNYVAGSGNITPSVGSSLIWNIPALEPDGEMTITYLLSTSPQNHSVRLFYDDMEGFTELDYDVYFDPSGETDNFWFPQDVLAHSGVQGWSVGDVDVESEHFMQNFEPYIITGDYPVYRFYHYYDTETGVDGGFLEISTDDGGSWLSLAPYLFRNTYPRSLQYTTFAIPNLFAFSGQSNTELVMEPVYIDLRDFIGESVKIRYRFGTDENTGGDGWYTDDIEIMDAVIYNSMACMTSDESDAICSEAPERGTIVDSQIINATEDGTTYFDFAVMPNPAGDYVQILLDAARTERVETRLYNITGQMVFSGNWDLQEGINQKVVDLQMMHAGMYVLQISTRDGMRSAKFIKE